MKVTNQTSDQQQIKICLYNPKDSVDWIPVGAGVFTVLINQTVPWTPPSGEGLDAYHVKVFKPAFFDVGLCAGDVAVNDDLVVRGGNGNYGISKA
jgi:hypothetical protein